MPPGPDHDTERLRPPELTARFELLTRLGRGTAGVVFRAIQRGVGRKVVLKLVAWDETASGDQKRRFEAEARLLSRFRHRHVQAVLESGILPGVAYLAYPDEGGVALDLWLSARFPRPQKVPVPVVVRLLDELLQGLAHIHGGGVVHRDLKPGNVLITEDGTVRIFDFGLARDLGSPERLTRTEALLGTPLYMGPEQIRGLEADHRDDLYAVGAMGYEMLAGVNPFAGGNLSLVLERQMSLVPEPLAKRFPEVPAVLSELLAEMLAKPRAGRPADAATARARLAPLLVGERSAVWDSEDARTYQSVVRRVAGGGGQRPWRLAAAVAAGALLSLALGALVRTRRTAPAPEPAPAATEAAPGERRGLDEAFARGLFDEVERLKPHQISLLSDPLAYDRLLERVPSMERFFTWLGAGGVPCLDLDASTRLALKTVDRAMDERGLPALMGGYLDPVGLNDSRHGPWFTVGHRAISEAIQQIEGMAAEVDSRREGAKPASGALEKHAELVAKLRTYGLFWGEGRVPMEQVAERFWRGSLEERLAWCRWSRKGAEALQKAIWCFLQSIRREPDSAEEASVVLVYGMSVSEAFTWSYWGRLPIEALVGGTPKSPWEWRIAADLAVYLVEVETEPARRTALLELARDGLRKRLEAPKPAFQQGQASVAQCFWKLHRVLEQLGQPSDLVLLWKKYVLPRIEDFPELAREVACSFPSIEGRFSGGPRGTADLARLILEVGSKAPTTLPEDLVSLEVLRTRATGLEPSTGR